MKHNTLEWHRKKLRYYLRYNMVGCAQIQKDTILAIQAKLKREKP